MLGLLRRSTKKENFMSYCHQLCLPALMKYIRKLEDIQHRAIKFMFVLYFFTSGLFILIDSSKFVSTDIIELADNYFSVKSLKDPTSNFNITNYLQLHNSSTRSFTNKITLKHVRSVTNLSTDFQGCGKYF